MKSINLFLVATSLLLSAVGVARAQTLYSTGFESPPFTLGASPNGHDGWVQASRNGLGFTVSDVESLSGTQSLFSNNAGEDGYLDFSSVRHDLGAWDGISHLQVSVRLWMEPVTEENRLYGLYLASPLTGGIGEIVLGLTISGSGVVRAGTQWEPTYTGAGIGSLSSPTGSWLTLELGYDPATTLKTVSVSGSGGTVSGSYLGGLAPVNVNLGTDWFGVYAPEDENGDFPLNRSGLGYFDDLSIEVIPEASAYTVFGGMIGLFFMELFRRRRS